MELNGNWTIKPDPKCITNQFTEQMKIGNWMTRSVIDTQPCT